MPLVLSTHTHTPHPTPPSHLTQEAAVDGISLETTPEELSTLSTYWQLQPFTNEAAVATLVEAVVAAADGAAAE